MSEDERSNMAAVVARGLVVVVKLVFVYMRLKRKARRAMRVFRKNLVKGGMDAETAQRLASEYECFVSIRKMIRSTGADLGPFSNFLGAP